MGSPICIARTEAALARLESWFSGSPLGEFELMVKGAQSPVEMHVTPSRFLALYFAAEGLERAVAAFPGVGKRKRLSLPLLFKQEDPAALPRPVA